MRESPFGQGSVKWVSTDWLEENLDQEGLMVLDTQPNIHDYILEHIPGALYMNEGLLRVPLEGHPAHFIDPEAIEPSLQRLGLRADVPVVVYTGTGEFKHWGDGLEQTMVAYSLARFGHDNVYILDGGLEKWKEEGRPLDKRFPDVRRSDFRVDLRADLYVNTVQVRHEMNNPEVMLIDARPQDLYAGQGPWIKPGHIPGAINIPWPSLMHPDNPRLLKPDQEIQEILDRNGVSRDKQIVWYCGTGREATSPFILFKWYLTYPRVYLYEGSFTDWTAYPENPVATGNEPGHVEQVLPGLWEGESRHAF